ncbi:MBL fold metallo-hydrolase [Patescibacteria group bacterium]|nr:MBL fold metallo-hydrolase [Patescibacteria group bacterium]MBU2416430.1 MBL fold metallo-hydrolase [Patescibacteria group bacterium]MBU2461105.1 MBL fold metallo-hydrolase [Patescibacteria group bacterium]
MKTTSQPQQKQNTLTLSFCGGASGPTGSNFLIESEDYNFLIDCGLFQGKDISTQKNDEPFSYQPSKIDALFVTHAHLDHIGRIPKLVQEGFCGAIYSTPPTKDIAELIFMDSMNVLSQQARRKNEKPPYTEKDVQKIIKLWQTCAYREPVKINNNLSIIFRDAGHILGSAMIEITYNNHKLLFTGDLGNTPAPLLHNTEKINDAKYIVMESVYGDRNHEDKNIRRALLRQIILETARKKGVLLIPVFSIERTQEMLFEFNHMVEKKEIPLIPIFLDSPLAIKVTEIYKRYEDYYNDNTRDIIKSGDDIFKFSMLRFISRHNDSLAIAHIDSPKVIMAGSGMSNGGRIVRHEKEYLSGPNNTLLLVGFQVAGTLGREIQEGAKKVLIDGEKIIIRARIETIHGYSAHKDSDNLLDFIEQANEDGKINKVFVALGEPRSSCFLTQKIRDYLDIDAQVAQPDEKVELLF